MPYGIDFLKGKAPTPSPAFPYPLEGMKAPDSSTFDFLQFLQGLTPSPAPVMPKYQAPASMDAFSNIMNGIGAEPQGNDPITDLLSQINNAKTSPLVSEPQTVMDAKPAPDPLDAMIQQIYGLMTQGDMPIDTESMINEASQGINKTYGAQIGAIRHQNQGAKADTKKGTKEIRQMYKALAADMNKSGNQEAKQGQNLAHQLQQLGASGADQITDNASQLLTQNAAAGQGLGSPELVEKLNSAVNTQTGHQAGNAINSATRQATNQLGMSGVNQRYFNEAAGSSNLEGTNRAADLIANLQDYLMGNRDKIAEIAGQKAQALAAAKNSIMSGASQDSSKARQDMIDNLMGLMQFQYGAQKDEKDAALEAMKSGSGLSGLLDKDFAGNNELLNQTGTLDLYKQLMGSEPALQGYLDLGHDNQVQLDNNLPALMQFLSQSPEVQNLTPEQYTALLSALLKTPFGSNQPSY